MFGRSIRLVVTGALSVVAAVSVAFAQDSEIPSSTGVLEILTGPTACDDRSCYEVLVTCSELASARANLKVAGTGNRGTIIFTTGGLGDGLYEESGQGGAILERAEASGFQTVQIQWEDSWLLASPGQESGHVELACRPATVAKWVYDSVASDDSGQAFCATGHSGGAAQISYMLSHYGLETILDGVVPTGGPPMARMDLSCAASSPDNEGVAFPGWARKIIDGGFGFLPEGDLSSFSTWQQEEGSGPCARGDSSHAERFRSASVASGEGDYVYPNTMVAFVFEGIDNTNAVAQGTFY